MKRCLLLMLLCLGLSACARQSEPVPVEPVGPAWYYLAKSDNLPGYGPGVLVDEQGTVVLESDHGRLGTLKDQATGETIALLWDHVEELPAEDNVISIYDLQGNFRQDVHARRLSCFGDLIAMDDGSDYTGNDTTLYRRSTGEILEEGLYEVHILDGVLIADRSTPKTAAQMAQMEKGEDDFFRIYDETGTVIWRRQSNEYLYQHSVGGKYYILGKDGKWGVVDAHGQWLCDVIYDQIYAVRDQDLLARRTEDTCEIWDPETDAVLWTHPYGFGSVFNESAVVFTSDDTSTRKIQLIDQKGEVIFGPCWSFDAVDTDNDGSPELFRPIESRETRNQYTFIYPDGSPACAFTTDDEVRLLSGRAAICRKTEQDGSASAYLMDLRTGKQIQLKREYENAGEPDWMSGTDFKLFWASYKADDGTERYDLYRDDGTLLLEGSEIRFSTQKFRTSAGDSVLVSCKVDGRYGLWQPDGTWLYRE